MRHPNQTLTERQVVLAREQHAAGVSIGALARRLNLTVSAVRQMLGGETYASFGGPLRKPTHRKLTVDPARIRALRRAGLTISEIARALQTTYRTVGWHTRPEAIKDPTP